MAETIVLKLVNNASPIKLARVDVGGGYVPYPQNTPTIVTQSISDLSKYSNTTQVLTFIEQSVANLHVANLADVTLLSNPPANNSSLVYNSSNSTYVVEQMPVDGGSF